MNNIFKNFGFSGNGHSDTSAIVENTPTISKEMFVDEAPPISSPQKDLNINEFIAYIQRDFVSLGFKDGYHNPVDNYRVAVEEGIRSEAALKAEIVIQEKKVQLLRLKTFIINIGKSSPEDKEISEANIKSLEEAIGELVIEKDYAMNFGQKSEGGLIMKAISDYRAGFKRGVSAYANEKLFAKSTNMFN